MNDLTKIRISTAKRTAALELPESWVSSTISAASNALDRSNTSSRVSRRRLTDKATRLASKGSL
jgi:hypothetical protein